MLIAKVADAQNYFLLTDMHKRLLIVIHTV